MSRVITGTLLLALVVAGCGDDRGVFTTGTAASSSTDAPPVTERRVDPATALIQYERYLVPGISDHVGWGEARFGEGDEPGSVVAFIEGTVEVVGGAVCLFCMDEIFLDPGLWLPLDVFNAVPFEPDAAEPFGSGSAALQITPVGPVILDVAYCEMDDDPDTGEASEKEPCELEAEGAFRISLATAPDVFIVAGPEGAEIEKDGATFEVDEGLAFLDGVPLIIEDEGGGDDDTAETTAPETTTPAREFSPFGEWEAVDAADGPRTLTVTGTVDEAHVVRVDGATMVCGTDESGIPYAVVIEGRGVIDADRLAIPDVFAVCSGGDVEPIGPYDFFLDWGGSSDLIIDSAGVEWQRIG